MKQKVKLVMATLFLFLTMTVYAIGPIEGACKDCGNESNCYDSNQLDSGFPDCDTDGTTWCKVDGGFGNCEQVAL